MRRLSPEEAAAWRRVARSVQPLRAEGKTAIVAQAKRSRGTGSGEAENAQRTAASLGPALRLRSGRADFVNGSQNTLDGSWDKRLATGRVEPDFTIDLHGETLASAHAKLNHGLRAAIRGGARIVLLITGRPARDNPRLPPASRGVIRASVQDWLAASSYATHIVAIRAAHPRHGGAGALYLILRRGR